MKQKSFAYALLTLLLLSFTDARSQNLSANTVNIGTGNLFQNFFGAPSKGLAIGGSNQLHSNYNFAVGSNNWLGEGTWAEGSAAIGESNRNSGAQSLTVGTYNHMQRDSEFGSGRDSIVAGNWNHSWGVSSLIMGLNNSIPYFDTGYEGSPLGFPVATMLLGKGLISRTDECVVVGKNNLAAAERQTGGQAPVFVVGVGESASARADALVVRANGDIVITKPQGDISMGIYE
jgi:hypothetical protein